MDELEKQRGVPGLRRPRAEEPGHEAPRPFPGDQTRLSAALDLSQQEKSLEALGRTFKAKREINGLTRRDVVVKIKIPMDQLESIEDGRLSALPPVFAKGFLRAYANELGLDAEAILDHYRQLTGDIKNEPAAREDPPVRYVEKKVSSGGRPNKGRRLLAVLVVLLLGVAASFWAWPDFWVWRAVAGLWPVSIWNSAAETEPVRPEGEPEPALSAEAEQLAPGGPEVAVVSGSLAGAAAAEERPAPAEAEVAEVEAEAPAPVQEGGELTLVSQKDEVWLQIIVDDQPVQHYWLKRGQTVVQQAERTVVVRTNQATALTATWNGQNLGVLSDQPVVEASFPPG
jgi:cytoskeletal protein RodZ